MLLWQTGHRAAAAALAEPLARIMEALPREAALRLALLLLDVHLQAGRPEPSARVIAQLEALLRDGGPSIDQALTLHVAKARLHFLCGAPKAARRELKSASATAAAAGSWAGPGALLASLQSSFLKAKEEMGKGNHRKASRLLAAGGAVAGDAAPTQLRSLFAAGGGALLHSLRKHETASLAYARALRLAVEAQTQPAESHSTAHLSSTQLDQLCYAAGAFTRLPGLPLPLSPPQSPMGPFTNFLPAGRAGLSGPASPLPLVARDQMAWRPHHTPGLPRRVVDASVPSWHVEDRVAAPQRCPQSQL